MKEIEFKDVAHLYIGCRCNYKYVDWETWNENAPFDIGEYTRFMGDASLQIKPNLRPLSSLTESEARELWEIETGEAWGILKWQSGFMALVWWSDHHENQSTVLELAIGNPKIWLKLLECGFDLYDLLERNLAVEK